VAHTDNKTTIKAIISVGHNDNKMSYQSGPH